MTHLKIANLNVSGGFYIGNEDTEYLDRAAVDSVDDKLLNQIIDFINTKDLDLICFQEIITTEDVKYIQTLTEKTSLKYAESFELSECNIVKDTKCGVAILSKYPLTVIKKELFPNPKLSKTTSSGNTYYTYDKGYLLCEADLGDQKITVMTHHGFPFRRFNSSPEANPAIFTFFDEAISTQNPDVVTGDFNADDFMSLMPRTDAAYMRTINEITTVDGHKFDDILLRKNTTFASDIVKILSDHYLVLVDLTL